MAQAALASGAWQEEAGKAGSAEQDAGAIEADGAAADKPRKRRTSVGT